MYERFKRLQQLQNSINRDTQHIGTKTVGERNFWTFFLPALALASFFGVHIKFYFPFFFFLPLTFVHSSSFCCYIYWRSFLFVCLYSSVLLQAFRAQSSRVKGKKEKREREILHNNRIYGEIFEDKKISAGTRIENEKLHDLRTFKMCLRAIKCWGRREVKNANHKYPSEQKYSQFSQ